MTLASALRSAVRQDSEVLLVSEIRDPDTAEAAIQASLTGHLVFASLHATDVATALRRLTQLGVPAYALRSGVRAVIAQRLIRRLCKSCGGFRSEACQGCMGSRYRGRIPIAQCIRLDGTDPVGEALCNALEAGHSLAVMRQQAAIAQADAGIGAAIDLYQRAQSCIESGQPTRRKSTVSSVSASQTVPCKPLAYRL